MADRTAAAPQPPPPGASAALGVTCIVMSLLGWSSIPLFLKHFSHLIDPWTSNGWRYAVAAAFWAPVLVMGVRNGRRGGADGGSGGGGLPVGLWGKAVWPAVFNTLGQAAFTWAHYKIDPGLLTFGLRLQIIFVAVGAYMLFPSERGVVRSWRYIAGFLMVMGGGLGTIFLGERAPTGGEAFGIALAIFSGFGFAAYALSVRRCMAGVRPVVAFSAISLYTAGAMVVLMLLLGERLGATALSLGRDELALLVASSLIGIALGHVFYYISIATLGVAISSGVVQLQPVLVLAASWVLFGERMTGLQLAGGGVAIGGALMMLSVQGRLGKRDSGKAEKLQMEKEEEEAELMATGTGAEGMVALDGNVAVPPIDRR